MQHRATYCHIPRFTNAVRFRRAFIWSHLPNIFREVESIYPCCSKRCFRGTATSSINIPLTVRTNKERTIVGMTRYLRKIEYGGTRIQFDDMPSRLLKWAKLNLNINNQEELITKYEKTFWYRPQNQSWIQPQLRSIVSGAYPAEGKSTIRQRKILKHRTLLPSSIAITSEAPVGLATMLARLVNQYQGIKSDPGSKIRPSTTQYLIQDPGAVMAVECQVCRRPSIDRNVRWWKKFPEYYVAHSTLICPGSGCTGIPRWLVPRDGDILWRSCTSQSLRVRTPVPPETLVTESCKASHEGLPQIVHVHCCKCGSSHAKDEKPRWFGQKHPSYVCPR